MQPMHTFESSMLQGTGGLCSADVPIGLNNLSAMNQLISSGNSIRFVWQIYHIRTSLSILFYALCITEQNIRHYLQGFEPFINRLFTDTSQSLLFVKGLFTEIGYFDQSYRDNDEPLFRLLSPLSTPHLSHQRMGYSILHFLVLFGFQNTV